MERRLERVENAGRLGSASVDEPGTLTARNAAGRTILYIGKLASGDFGVIFYRADGSLAFAMYDPLGGTDQFMAMYDQQGNIVVGDDAASSQGLARPYLTVPAMPDSTSADVTTTSGSMTNLWQLPYTKQHPKLDVTILARASDGTTNGSFDVYDETIGQVLGSAQSVGLGGFSYLSWTVTVPGSHLSFHELRVRGRRTAGAGTVGCRVQRALAVQS